MVAKRDIECIKYLYKSGDGFITPARYTPVELDKELVASPSTPDIKEVGRDALNDKIYALNGGAIHAKLNPNGMTDSPVKAIIPKGTKYWVDTFGTEIAAEKMLITSKKASNEYNLPMAADILAAAPELNGVRVGDFLLKGGKYIHPSKRSKMFKPIGRVVGFHDGKPLVAALNSLKGEVDTSWDSKLNEHLSSEEAKKDFNGVKNTQSYKDLDYEGKEKRYNAYAECVEYDKEHDSYFPALGEMMEMLRNALYLNASAFVSGLGEIIDDNKWWWTSSEGSRGDSWICGLDSGGVGCGWYGKSGTCRVVPFLASPEK